MISGQSISKSIKLKVISIGLVLGFVFVFSSIYLTLQYTGKTKDQRLRHLKQTVQIARNSIEPILVEYRSQNKSMAKTLQQIRDLVRRMVYDDQYGKNYIFMSAYDGTMLVQPYEPQKEMTDTWDLRDPHGVYIIRELVKIAKSKQGQGFASYHYQRPGEKKPEEKIAFVIGIPDLGCYIGTGQYMTEHRKDQLLYIIKNTGLTAVLLTLLFFLVQAFTKEIRTQNLLLHTAEQELSAIFNNTFQLIGTLTPDGKLTKINHSALNYIQQDETSVIGKSFWDTPWWQEKDIKARLKKAVHDCSKGSFCRFEYTFNQMNQENTFIDFNLSPIFNEKNNVVSLLAEGRDMTELIKAKNDLIKEKEFSENLINSLPGLFFLYQRQKEGFVLKKWNRQHETLLGFSSQELQNAPMTTFVEKQSVPVLNASVTKVLERGKLSVELYLKDKNGSSIPFLFMARSFEQFKNTYIIGTGIELSEQKQAQETNKALERQLTQAQKMESVGRLAGGVAHDFNNMLGVILGHTELALEQAEKNTDVYSDLKAIQTAAQRSADITKQLLAFARKQTISPIQLDLNDTVESMLNMLRRLIGEDIDLVWKPDAHIWPVKMDPSQIDQTLANLCVNARDAISGVGKLTIETGRKSFDEQYCKDHPGFIPGDFVLLAVSDNGCGMDKDTLDNLFEPFFTTKDVGKGTGLGLATLYGIVKQNNGFIDVYSEPGQGSVFKVYLPRLVAETDTDRAVPEKKAAEGGTETILLVEDEPSILSMTRMMLEKKGYTVLAAATPTEAIEKTKNHSGAIDLLMTDVVMPQMNGRDLSVKIIDLYPDIRLLFMSGYTTNVIAHQGVLDHGVAFIQKPFSMTDMTQKVRNVLDSGTNNRCVCPDESNL